jgi:hypothetical protein
LWAACALVVFLFSAILTRVITKVDDGATRQIGVLVLSTKPLDINRLLVSPAEVENERFRVPHIAVIGYHAMLFVVPRDTTSIAVYENAPFAMSCNLAPAVEAGTSVPLFAALVRTTKLAPLPVHADTSASVVEIERQALPGMQALTRRLWRDSLAVPDSIRAELRRVPDGEVAIRCDFPEPLSASPTFSSRTLTIGAPVFMRGSAAVDFSAFDGIDDVRFSGGIQVPAAGDRVRVVDPNDRFISATWSDEAALEQRDVVLVLVGGLAAIGAAMAIEAIRPFVESRDEL